MNLVLILGVIFQQAFCEESTTDTIAASDGEEIILAMPSMPDAITDIPNSFRNDSFLDVEIHPIESLNDTTSDSKQTTLAETSSVQTTLVPSTKAVTTTQKTSTLSASTTSTTITTTTAKPTTTTMPATSTTSMPTTSTTTMPTTSTTTTTTTMPTTDRSKSTIILTAIAERTTKSIATLSPTEKMPDEQTFQPAWSESDDEFCFFIDTNLLCNEEVVCRGEGEIDCTAEPGDPTPEALILHKISVSSISEDYSDTEIETYPPDLIGKKKSKPKHPLLFKMRSIEEALITYADDETTVQYESKKTNAVEATVKAGSSAVTNYDELPSKTPNELGEVTKPTVSSSPVSDLRSKSYETRTVEPTTKYQTKVSNEITVTTPATISDYVLNRTFLGEAVSAAIIEDASEEHVSIRKKRQQNIFSSESESSSSSMSISFQVQALEGSRSKIRIEACKVSGRIKCTPTPTTDMCKGRTYCQAERNDLEASEKSARTQGVEKWAIAVIAICAIAAALTISLLVYLVITSWKKLKVQPQSGVTTLTYVNTPT